jgi:L-aspartate oxidase
MFEKKYFKKRFPNIYANLKDLGYDLPSQRVPISPAFHYAMGGIETTLNAKVKSMQNLYAVGEVTCTGVHGANRLASNSLLEGLVFSQIAVETSLKENFEISCENYTKAVKSYTRNQEIDKDIKNNLRKIMWKAASIVRDPNELENALAQIKKYLKEDVGRLLFLRLLTAKSILESALNRKTSLGAHYIKEN